MAKFNKLDVPSQWKDEFTKYPHGYTIYEALCSWTKQVDSMVDNQNNWIDYLDNFVENFEFELQEEVQTVLAQWQDSGLLEDIINSALTTRLDAIDQQLSELKSNKMVVNVTDFGEVNKGSRPLSTKYTTLAEAQIDFPFATSLDNEMDYCIIQKAINYVYDRKNRTNLSGGWYDGGGVVYLPAGYYHINKTIDLKSNVTLQGESRESTILGAHSLDVALKNSGLGCSNIRNLTFLGSGVHFIQNYGSFLENVRFMNIRDEVNKNKISVLLQLTVGQVIQDLLFFNCDICIEVNGNAGQGPNTSTLFTRVWIQQCETGFVFSGTQTNPIDTTKLADSIIEYCDTAIKFNGRLRQIVIDNIHLEGNVKEIMSSLVAGDISISNTRGSGQLNFINVGAGFRSRHSFSFTDCQFSTPIFIQSGVNNLDIYSNNLDFIPNISSPCRLYNTDKELLTLSPTEGLFYKNGQRLKSRTIPISGVYSKLCVLEGYEARTSWEPSTFYSVNDVRYAGNNVYCCVVAGTSSTVPPAHTTGEANDGGVRWEFLGYRANFKDELSLT